LAVGASDYRHKERRVLRESVDARGLCSETNMQFGTSWRAKCTFVSSVTPSPPKSDAAVLQHVIGAETQLRLIRHVCRAGRDVRVSAAPLLPAGGGGGGGGLGLWAAAERQLLNEGRVLREAVDARELCRETSMHFCPS
jgi:hypothetical protein